MSANGIAHLATKELRQKAKLDLAQQDRISAGKTRTYYDSTQLPTQYDDNSIIDNSNEGGLVVGRPWVATDPTPAPSHVTSNLVLYLDAGNASSYAGSGTTWTDLSGNSRNATLTNVTYSAANSGSLVFNGSTSIGVINDTVINRYTNNFSVEVWYTTSNNTPRLLRTGASTSGFNFGSFTSTPTKFKVTKYGKVDLFVGSIPQNTAWHQAVLVYSSTGGVKVYVDGALNETNANTVNLNATAWTYLEIGRSEGTGSHNGNIGIVRYYNAVLSDADVLQNFNANKARYGL